MSAAAADGASTRTAGRRFTWPIGYVAVILFLFLLYDAILPNLTREVSGPIAAWLPAATVNECLMWGIMAVGLNVVVGYAGLLDLGYVAFWALGGYTAGWLMAYPFNWVWDFHLLSPVPASVPGTHISFWLVIIVAGCLCAVLGVVIGAPTLRLRGDYLALVTLGFGEVIAQFFKNSNDIAGRNIAGGDAGIPSIDPIGTGPLGALGIAPKQLTSSASGNAWKILALGFLLAMCIFVSLRIRDGRLGRAWLAIREDELAASMMGVPLVSTKLLAYAVGAFFGGIGGVANVSGITTSVSPSGFDSGKSVLLLLMVVLGGMGNVWGVTIGAFLLSWLNSAGLKQIGVQTDQIFGTHLAGTLPRYTYIIFGLLLVLMMLFRPGGLVPERRISALMRTPARTEAESLGADSIEVEAETEAVEHADAETDARIAASAIHDLSPPRATSTGARAVSALPPDASRLDPGGADVLRADHVTVRFGGLVAVDDVSFTIPPRSVVSLIGPNGAGKTTFFNVLSGLYGPTEGTVHLDGEDVTRVKPHVRASMGLARTFQNIRLFHLMTAAENVMVATHPHLRSGMFSTIVRTPRQRREEREARDSARALLEYVGIGAREGELARNLSYGDQRRLEIARAMALRPKVLLLDEPTAGMNPQESAAFIDFVHRVREELGISVLLIEHDMSVIMKISDRITVLDRGAVIAEGRPEDIRNDPAVIEAYLGKSRDRDDTSKPVAPSTTTPRPATARGAGKDVVLDLRGISVGYGNIAAVQDLDLTVYAGEIVTLLGSNGAGKSTTLRTISGLLRPRHGDIVYKGRRIDGIPGHDVARLGICQAPEGRRIFPRMTVSENLDLGAFVRDDADAVAEDRERVLDLFPQLRERIGQDAGTLSGGEQQMLAVARALLGNPSLLLLDEPSMGLAPRLVDVIFDTISRIRDQGVTVLVVEQNARAALEIADYAYVLESGRLTMQGEAADLLGDPSVTAAYLGGP